MGKDVNQREYSFVKDQPDKVSQRALLLIKEERESRKSVTPKTPNKNDTKD